MENIKETLDTMAVAYGSEGGETKYETLNNIYEATKDFKDRIEILEEDSPLVDPDTGDVVLPKETISGTGYFFLFGDGVDAKYTVGVWTTSSEEYIVVGRKIARVTWVSTGKIISDICYVEDMAEWEYNPTSYAYETTVTLSKKDLGPVPDSEKYNWAYYFQTGGNNSVALGVGAESTTPNAVAIGMTARAGSGSVSGTYGHIALGSYSSAYSSEGTSVAIGYSSYASGEDCIAIGGSSSSQGEQTITIGHGTNNGNYSVLIATDPFKRSQISSDSTSAISIGGGSITGNSLDSITIGTSSMAYTLKGIQIGTNIDIRGTSISTKREGTIAIGNEISAYASNVTLPDNAVILGCNPNFNTPAISGGPAFIIGNGTPNTKSTLFAVNSDGNEFYIKRNGSFIKIQDMLMPSVDNINADGTYVLKMTVVNGVKTFAWVAE